MRALSSSSVSTSGRASYSLPWQQPHRTSLRRGAPPPFPHRRRRCHRNQTLKTPTPKTTALPAWPSSSSDSSPSGRTRWRVRPIRPEEIVAAAELQARAFYTSYPLGPLDALMFYQFRGEVLSGLQSKMKYSQEDGFVCLVAERVPPLRSLFSLGASSSKTRGRSTNIGGGGDDGDDDDLSALDEFSTSPSGSSSLPSIAGVVEVSLQGEKRELEALWGVTGLMNGINDGGSGGGGASETDNGLIRGLLAGWSAAVSPLPSEPDDDDDGGGALLLDESYAYVACMAVDERCRRAGAASALLAAAERAAGRWRQTWVLLHVHERNAAARALYASAGYAELGPAERPGIVGAPRVLMGKQSSPAGGFPASSSAFSSSDASSSPSASSSEACYESSSSPSSFAAPGGGIMSIPSDLLGALKRDSEERAAKAKEVRRDKEERERRG